MDSYKKYTFECIYFVALDSNRSPIIKLCTVVYRWFQVETYLREKGLKLVERDSSENHPDPCTRRSRWFWTRIEDVSTGEQGFVIFCGQRWLELKMEGTRKFWGSDKSLLEISLETDRGRLASVGDGCGAKGVDWVGCSNRLVRITFAQIDKLVGLDVGWARNVFSSVIWLSLFKSLWALERKVFVKLSTYWLVF